MITRASLLVALSRHIGRAKGVSVKQLVCEICGESSSGSDHERLIREYVVELRMIGHHVCATPRDGYFIADTEEELLETCEYLYIRAMTSLTQVARMRRESLPDLRGQLRLPLENQSDINPENHGDTNVNN